MAGSAHSSSKRQKLIDRLSNLPKHILLHILSFLPTKTAAATSVLSKPWQHLWTLVPAIDLDDDDDSGPCYHGMPPAITFEDSLITKVLNNNKSPIIRRFRLSGRQCLTYYLDKWLSSATKRNVEELDLDYHAIYDDVNPSQFSFYATKEVLHPTFAFSFAPESCKTLVVMKVSVSNMTDLRLVIGGDLDFPSLKVLHLKTVGFESKDPSRLGFFSSQFPLLEELAVLWATFQHDINVSLPTLRRLEIESTLKYTLNIEAPALQYIVVRSIRNGWFRVSDLPNLVEAKVDVCYDDMGHREYGETLMINERCDYGESLINFVNALSNARVLNLSIRTMKALSSHSLFHAHRVQPFHNLVELDIQLDVSLLGIMVIMLSKFENLEHLKIRDTYDSIYNNIKTEYSLVPPTHVPNCLTYKLKTFYSEDFRCSQTEMEFAIYILKNSLVLENVKILFRPRLAWKKGDVSKETLSKTSRGSLECQLEFDQKVSEYEDIENYSDYSE